MDNSFVIEWSFTQKTFNLQSSGEMLSRNLDSLICGRDNDFVPIFSFYSLSKAEIALDALKNKVNKDGVLDLAELRHVITYLFKDME